MHSSAMFMGNGGSLGLIYAGRFIVSTIPPPPSTMHHFGTRST